MITEKFHKLLINRQTNINLPFLFCFDGSAHRELKEEEEGGIVQKRSPLPNRPQNVHNYLVIRDEQSQKLRPSSA